MDQLSQMPNIGAVLEQKLIHAGIGTPDLLIETGSKDAFLRLRKDDPGACLHSLYALEGAVQGVRKPELPTKTKKELKDFFNSL